VTPPPKASINLPEQSFGIVAETSKLNRAYGFITKKFQTTRKVNSLLKKNTVSKLYLNP